MLVGILSTVHAQNKSGEATAAAAIFWKRQKEQNRNKGIIEPKNHKQSERKIRRKKKKNVHRSSAYSNVKLFVRCFSLGKSMLRYIEAAALIVPNKIKSLFVVGRN